jgi:glycosyltransferase involved in cell wall biosynthesis
MTINFLLPGVSKVAIGGYKVAYEYANKLAEDGYTVNIIYPLRLDFEKENKRSWVKKIKIAVETQLKNNPKNISGKAWFPLHDKINETLVPCLHQKYIPNAYATIATAWHTAEWLNSYTIDKGKKFYLIQHFEDWSGTKEKIDATWKLDLHKMVISRWLQDYATSLHQPSSLVNNGLDFSKYNLDNSIEQRDGNTVIMLYHNLAWKGSKYGIEALEIAKQKNNTIKAILFGNDERPQSLPQWITYYQSPKNLRELYNSASIFISPSFGEGWALPPAEAMQCGCATILTNIGGHRDYGEENKDLLFVPTENAIAMADKILWLVDNNEERIRIAKSGNQTIKHFTWERAYTTFKKVLLQ